MTTEDGLYNPSHQVHNFHFCVNFPQFVRPIRVKIVERVHQVAVQAITLVAASLVLVALTVKRTIMTVRTIIVKIMATVSTVSLLLHAIAMVQATQEIIAKPTLMNAQTPPLAILMARALMLWATLTAHAMAVTVATSASSAAVDTSCPHPPLSNSSSFWPS